MHKGIFADFRKALKWDIDSPMVSRRLFPQIVSFIHRTVACQREHNSKVGNDILIILLITIPEINDNKFYKTI